MRMLGWTVLLLISAHVATCQNASSHRPVIIALLLLVFSTCPGFFPKQNQLNLGCHGPTMSVSMKSAPENRG
jgi:hypothetical protein